MSIKRVLLLAACFASGIGTQAAAPAGKSTLFVRIAAVFNECYNVRLPATSRAARCGRWCLQGMRDNGALPIRVPELRGHGLRDRRLYVTFYLKEGRGRLVTQNQ